MYMQIRFSIQQKIAPRIPRGYFVNNGILVPEKYKKSKKVN